jgi:D-alanyl-D-alanine carboxypeptidase/D-alanyl-D-alanine-endopeptidase (penicillin-binding protein 4)
MLLRYILTQGLCLVAGTLLIASCGSKEKEEKKTAAHCTVTIPIDQGLKNRLIDFASKPRVKGKFGMYVYDLTANRPVYGFHENVSIPSASCLKLLTGISGLHILGTHYKYATSIYTRGSVRDGILEGDIAFKGDLDPQLNEPDLSMFAKALKRKGIRKLTGHLYLDLLLHDPVKSEQHWYPWDLSFSRYGILYKGAPKVKKELRSALRNQGIVVADSQVVMGKVPKGSHCIFRFYRGIEKVIKRMWKNSSNTQATSLLYTIGHRVNPHQHPTVAGVGYLRHFLKNDLGQRDTSLVIHDGCGLCTYNHLSPKALTEALIYGYQHKLIYGVLYRNLSIAGVDGTLRSELSEPKLRGKVRGKTGTLSHPYGISSLAGYCKGSNGHMLAFSIMDSEMSVLDARVLQRDLCKVLVK